MSGDGFKLWAVIVLVGAANYLARWSFIALLARTAVPPWALRALRYVAVAMLAALVVPMVLAPTGTAVVAGNPRVPAALLAGGVAFFTRSTLWTLAAGMLALWLLEGLRGG